MEFNGTYTLDMEMLKLNAYRLICLFYANKEISRLSNPDCGNDDSPSELERQFFSKELTKLLLTIAIGIRVLDDQMNIRPIDDPVRKTYEKRMRKSNQHHSCMMFDHMTLRDVCNKIIHANIVEPHSTDGEPGIHEIDGYNQISWSMEHEDFPDKPLPEPEPIKWKHLSGHVRLGGRKAGKEWFHLLEVPVFVEAIHEVLTDGI